MSSGTKKNPLHDELIKKNADANLIAQSQVLSSTEVSQCLKLIDDSSYSLSEWVESLIEFDTWAKREKRSLKLMNQVEYLSCCTESPSGGAKLPLPFLLQEFLRTNGVD